MIWSRKDSDPLQDEIKRLDQERKTLERQAKILEEELEHPVIREEREISRGARILNDTLQERLNRKPNRKRRRVRAQERSARNRVFLGLLVLALLVLVLWRIVS